MNRSEPAQCGPCVTDQLLSLINGYRVSQAICVIATLGIPDLLANGPRSSGDLADATGSNPEALHRVLRALTAVNVLREVEPQMFMLTDLGALLRSDVPGSRNAWAKFMARPPMWNAWGALLHTLKTGENAFQHVHGKSTWHFRAEHPEESAIFDAAMRENSAGLIEALVAAVDFSRFAHIVDVGGGDGTLLAGILANHPEATGTLLDQPHVITRANAVFAQAGVAGRANAVGASFFEHVAAGGDAYLLKHILHDWHDADALTILRNCRQAMAGSARLIVVERIVEVDAADADTLLSDLNMLVNAGGRERSLDEFRAMFAQTGFALDRIANLHGSRHAIEATLQ
jgi:hypothetical protein